MQGRQGQSSGLRVFGSTLSTGLVGLAGLLGAWTHTQNVVAFEQNGAPRPGLRSRQGHRSTRRSAPAPSRFPRARKTPSSSAACFECRWTTGSRTATGSVSPSSGHARTKPADRIGVMVGNPGGPGISGVDFVLSVNGAPGLARLQERFDIVSFDPRGVKRSRQVRCDFEVPAQPSPSDDTALSEFFDEYSRRHARVDTGLWSGSSVRFPAMRSY